jgi:hypothetical protein
MTEPILGMDCIAYYCVTNLDGSVTTPENASWLEMANFKDVTLSRSRAKADITTRANRGHRASRGTFMEENITGKIMWLPGDAAFDAIQSAFEVNTLLAMAFMDGDIDTAGSQGLVANMSVTGFTRNEPLEEGVTVDVTLEPSSQIEWYESAGS